MQFALLGFFDLQKALHIHNFYSEIKDKLFHRVLDQNVSFRLKLNFPLKIEKFEDLRLFAQLTRVLLKHLS